MLVQPTRTSARASCPSGAAEAAANSSGLINQAEQYWSNTYPNIEFLVNTAVCGNLTRDRRPDMAIGLSVTYGTGGSPKPFGIVHRTVGGEYALRHIDFTERKLVCPQTLSIKNGTFRVYRPSKYNGAYTVCDRRYRFRWRHGAYEIQVSKTFKSCYRRSFRRLQAAGISCRLASRIAIGVESGVPPPRWSCSSGSSGRTTCLAEKGWRRWLRWDATRGE